MTHILRDDNSPVRQITIDRPNRLNSPDSGANDELVEVWRAFVSSDQLARTVGTTGAGAKACGACNHRPILRKTIDLAERAIAFREKPPPQFARR